MVRHIYRYWYNEPSLDAALAKMGLQALIHAFPAVDPRSFRILDIIRGEIYSLDKIESSDEDFVQLKELHSKFCVEYDETKQG